MRKWAIILILSAAAYGQSATGWQVSAGGQCPAPATGWDWLCGTGADVLFSISGQPYKSATQGPQGIPGVPGQNGSNGQNGAPGQNATIVIGSVTTGTPAVTNSGTPTNAILNFTLSPGPPGSNGVGYQAGTQVSWKCAPGKGTIQTGATMVCTVVSITQP